VADINIHLEKYGLSVEEILTPKIASAVQSAIVVSLAVIKDRWQSEAQRKLHSTLQLYLLGLDYDSIMYPYEGNAFAGAIQLHGQFPNMLESGWGAFDEKIGFKKSNKVKMTKNGGWYLTIPIRHSTPNSYLYGKPMTKDVYSEAKKLGNMESMRVEGGQSTSWNGYKHKNNIYDGLTRIIKSYHSESGKTTKQSQYFTFRRVSNNSDHDSWMHPGYAGIHLSKQLETFAADTFSYNMNRALSAVSQQ
jgi:hypothetical protein